MNLRFTTNLLGTAVSLFLLLGVGAAFAPSKGFASSGPIDTLIFGEASSESAHGLTSTLSETYVGDLGETARRFLPQAPAYYYGGSTTFTVEVDPVAQNYFTVKLSGSEFRQDENNGRMVLKCEGLEVGLRHGSDEEIFVDQSGEPISPGGFVYRTAGLPKWLTKGKTKVTLQLQSTGRFFAYGTIWNYDTYQRKLLYPTRGVYRGYTHTNPRFDLPADDKPGARVVYSAAPPRPASSLTLADFQAECNKHISALIATTTYLTPNVGNNYYNDVEYLAFAYSLSWTTGYKNPALIAQVINSIDKNCLEYNADNTKVNAWGGAYGRFGYAIHLLWPQLQGRMADTVDLGLGAKTRGQYWAALLKASFDNGRFHRRTITNQELECVMSLYGANLGLRDINPAMAVPEASARRYLYEGVGLVEWPGDDLPAGGSAWNFGHGYYMMTAKGTSHEPGWVAQDCYGNLGPKIVELWRMCGDPAILQRAVDLEKAQSYFRYPSVDGEGYRAILCEGVICWRNEYDPGVTMYGCPWTAAASGDAVLLGYQRQMLTDNQFLQKYVRTPGYIKETKSLFLPEAYNIISAHTALASNPCTPGQPDYAYADEENGILALKRGNELFFIQLYRRAYAINYLAKAHHITSETERIIEFYVGDVRFSPSGKFKTRDGKVEPATDGTPPDNPVSAYQGVQQPIPLLEDGTEASQNRAIAQFYGCSFGNYLIGMNCTKDKSFQYSPPGFTSGVDLVSGRTLTSPITVGPYSTVVFYQTAAVPSPVITSSPASQTVHPGSTPTFSAAATGLDLRYQWMKNGVPIAGATGSVLTLNNVTVSDSGSYTVVVSNASGQITSPSAILSVDTTLASPRPGHLVNLSVRSRAGTGEQTLIAGFIISGAGTKPIMVRASGPSLANFNVSGALKDPALDLHLNTTVLAQNDSWKSAPNQPGIVAASGHLLGAFPLDPKDAIILSSLQPNAYTALVTGADGGSGVALVELYDTDPAQPGTPEFDQHPRLINISARSQVGTGDNLMIAGFVINGSLAKRVMIRACGSTLTHFGIAGVLANPVLQLYQGQTLIAQNNGWQTAPNITEIRSLNGDKEGSYILDPRDAVLLVTLAPGAYTAQVSGANGATGVALVEVLDED